MENNTTTENGNWEAELDADLEFHAWLDAREQETLEFLLETPVEE